MEGLTMTQLAAKLNVTTAYLYTKGFKAGMTITEQIDCLYNYVLDLDNEAQKAMTRVNEVRDVAVELQRRGMVAK